MAGIGDRNRSLREALFESLTAILSPLHPTRVAGEEQIKALEVTEEFGIHLAEFTVDPNGNLAIRQLSCVLLKQYVEAHWSHLADKYRPPETSDTSKCAIRKILPVGLKESISKVRSSVAYAVSAIAHWDWPEEWPELFGILMQALTSSDPNAVHGAMRVLTEFTQDISDAQMSLVAPVVLPEMYKIFTQSEVYSIRTRCRAVDIFKTCVGMIAAMAEIQKSVIKQLLLPVLPQFTEAFIQALQIPDGPTSDSGMKMEVLKAVTCLVKNFPKLMSEWLSQLLPPVWSIFTQSVDIYIRTVVNTTDEADDPVDSDGEVLGFENLVYSVFEFVHVLIDNSRFRAAIKKSIDQILYFVILYMQITEDQVRIWTASPNQFVEDEDDDTFAYSVRISAQDLLLSLSAEFQSQSGPALCQSITRHLQESAASKHAGNQHWWKVHESCMLALGSVKTMIIDGVQKGKLQFDINGFLQTVVLPNLSSSDSPFLVGRCLWIASRYPDVMPHDISERCLQATVSALQPDQPSVIRISAIQAVFGFCEHLKYSNNTSQLGPYLLNLTEGLVSMATQFSAEVLALSMETLAVVLSVDKNFTASIEQKVTPLTIAIFLTHCNDPLIISITQSIFKELADNENCMPALQQRLLPTLVSILNAAPGKVPVAMPAVALDMLETVVRSSKPPLSDALINSAFPAAARCVLNTDDISCMQNGGECIRAFASVSFEQIVQWRDEQGNNGMDYIIQIISTLLDPKKAESAASYIGKLVSVVIRKVGPQMGESLDLMLRAVLSKMQQVDVPTVTQSLVMIFAHLMNSKMEAVLEFLCSVPGPTGKPALEFVLTEWCSKQNTFYGAYDCKVSTVALSKLLLHAINTNDKRLQDIQVKGDPIVSRSPGIRTRSKTAKSPEEWTMIPVLVKVYKLLISELSDAMESAMSRDVDAHDLDDENGWDDDDDDDEGDLDDDDDVACEGQTLSSLLQQYTDDYKDCDIDDEKEDDPDILEDPVFQIDLQAYLTEFLQTFSQQPCYQMFSANQNDLEKQVLRSIGISV